MGIESLNRFHWALLGIFLGVAISYAWVGTTGNVENKRAVTQQIFETELIQKEGELPLISGIVVHPVKYSPADRAEVHQVSYKRLARDNQTGKMGYWLDRWFVASIPFRPRMMRIPIKDPNQFTVETYLSEISKQPGMNFVKFRYGWWMIPKNAMIVGGAAGLVILGGVWPTLLGIMTGAGLGPKKKPKTESLWNYKSKTPEKQQAHKPIVTAQDRARLDSLTSSYEKELAASGVSMTGADSEPAATVSKTAQELRKLETGPLKEVAKDAADDDTELKYKEYYPVVVHHKKPDDDHGPKIPGVAEKKAP